MTLATRDSAKIADPASLTATARRRRTVRAGALVLSDILALVAAHMAAGLPVVLIDLYQQNLGYWEMILGGSPLRSMQAGAFGLALIVWFHHCGHYTARLPAWTDVRHILGGCALVMVTHGFLQFALKDEFSRLWLLSTWLFAVPALIVARRLTSLVLRRLDAWDIPVLLVGTGNRIALAADMLAHDRSLACRVVNTVELAAIPAIWRGSWARTCQSLGTEMVVVAAAEEDLATQQRLIARLSLEGIPFMRVQTLGGFPAIAMEAHYLIGQDALLLLGKSPLSRPFGQLLKRTVDLVGAIVALLLLAPVMLVIAALLLLDGGPVFYRHRRVGWEGRPFDCLKFRTMVRDADTVLRDCLAADPARRAEWEQSRKLRDDPRITPLGQVVRRWSLDELPQLFNVLGGQMSLVGPRPMTGSELERHGPDHPFYYHVRPGMTGLWQVSGRSTLDNARRDELDMWYVTNWSLWLDTVILMRTIPAVLGRHGAF